MKCLLNAFRPLFRVYCASATKHRVIKIGNGKVIKKVENEEIIDDETKKNWRIF